MKISYHHRYCKFACSQHRPNAYAGLYDPTHCVFAYVKYCTFIKFVFVYEIVVTRLTGAVSRLLIIFYASCFKIFTEPINQ